MSKLFCLFLMAFAIVDLVNCSMIREDFEPHIRERRQLRKDIPIGNRGSIFGSIGEGDVLSGRVGASRDFHRSNDGKFTGEIFASRDLGLNANGVGGNLQWKSDNLNGKIEAERFRGYNTAITAQGGGTLWKPNKNTELTGFFGGSTVLGSGRRPDINTGLNFRHRF